jgi:hypothetical protein
MSFYEHLFECLFERLEVDSDAVGMMQCLLTEASDRLSSYFSVHASRIELFTVGTLAYCLKCALNLSNTSCGYLG